MSIEPRKLKVGRDAVVIGNVAGEVGDGSVVIGPTDDRGNTVLNETMAAGRGAFAGPGSVAIGAGAGAGTELPLLVNQLADAIRTVNDDAITERFNELVDEFDKDDVAPDKANVTSVLRYLGGVAALSDVWSLVERIEQLVAHLL